MDSKVFGIDKNQHINLWSDANDEEGILPMISGGKLAELQEPILPH